MCGKEIRYRGEKYKLQSTDTTRCKFRTLASNVGANRYLLGSMPRTGSQWSPEEMSRRAQVTRVFSVIGEAFLRIEEG